MGGEYEGSGQVGLVANAGRLGVAGGGAASAVESGGAVGGSGAGIEELRDGPKQRIIS